MSQSRLHSLSEAVNGGLLAAPTAFGLHYLITYIAVNLLGFNLAQLEASTIYISVTWFMFLIHSVIWKFAIRMIYERYGFKLEPTRLNGIAANIAKRIYRKATYPIHGRTKKGSKTL